VQVAMRAGNGSADAGASSTCPVVSGKSGRKAQLSHAFLLRPGFLQSATDDAGVIWPTLRWWKTCRDGAKTNRIFTGSAHHANGHLIPSKTSVCIWNFFASSHRPCHTPRRPHHCCR
jgi:hypothetical protein